jgi:thiol-disulfide isomerase/thioredoxin/uncharacterized membrane protein YphA (DoxX/SURF4 family)
MGVLLMAARLGLAAVFVVAGVGKLADLAGSRRAVAEFGVPEELATALGVFLPLAELAVAAALFPNLSAWWGALGALLLLLVFIAGISFNLARGQKPDCHCFGQIYSEPVGPSTLIRNGVLAALAVFVLFAGQSSVGADPLAWTTALTNAERAALVIGALVVILLGAQCWLLIELSRQNIALLQRTSTVGNSALLPLPAAQSSAVQTAPDVDDAAPQGLPVGSPAPAFTVPDLDGQSTSLQDLLADAKPVMLLFTNPDCGPCAALMPEIAHWQAQYADYMSFAVVGEGTVEVNRPKADQAGLQTVYLQTGREVAVAYHANATPAAVMVYPGEIVASPVAVGADSIRGLRDQVLALFHLTPPLLLQDRAPARAPVPTETGASPAVVLGTPLPHVHVTEFTGETVELGDLVDGETLFLSWRTTCGFCEQMLPTLRAWETSPPLGAPKLVIILTPASDGNQFIDFRSTTVLDLEGEAARALGIDGTPMAVLCDADGLIAAPVAAGTSEVMELANRSVAQATA